MISANVSMIFKTKPQTLTCEERAREKERGEERERERQTDRLKERETHTETG